MSYALATLDNSALNINVQVFLQHTPSISLAILAQLFRDSTLFYMMRYSFTSAQSVNKSVVGLFFGLPAHKKKKKRIKRIK